MSGRSTASSCCPSVVTDVLVCPPNLCTQSFLNCDDFISIAIQAILNLRGSRGSTALEIFSEALFLCPTTTVTQLDIDDALAVGARRGIFFRSISSVGAEPTYMVVARMALFNYQNRIYTRLPCQTDGFWASSV